jgi:hypothetical protein
LQKFNKKVSRFDSTRAGGARIVKGNWVLRWVQLGHQL